MFKKYLGVVEKHIRKGYETLRGAVNPKALSFEALRQYFWFSDKAAPPLENDPAMAEASENAPPATPRQYSAHPSPHYMDLKIRFRDIGRLSAIAETIGRDYLTSMPDGAARRRLGQIAYLYRRLHEDLICGDVAEDLDQAVEHKNIAPEHWDEWDSANLNQMRRIYIHNRHVPAELEEERAKLSYNGRRVHRECMAKGDWKTAQDFLKDVMDTNKRLASARARGGNTNSLYQALMNEYIPDADIPKIDEWFGGLEKDLRIMLPKIIDKQAKEPTPVPLSGKYPADSQMWLNRCLLKLIGFDFNRGGLYETGHNPVEGGTPEDTRLVIKNVDTKNFMDSMKSVLHEGGHGIYIQGLPRDTWRYQPVAQDIGSAVHESQALLIEMMIGRTRAFYKYLSPRLEGLYHRLHDPALSPENLYRLKTRVKPTPDRKKADEVTYFFHVLMRYRMEKKLIDGELNIEDIPEIWNQETYDHLGVIPEGYQDGCLQDVHWFVGKFGYFPSYTIGHMMAAQLYETLGKEFPDLERRIEDGNLSAITKWLKINIYQKGRLMENEDLFKTITGRKIGPEALVKHLERRYLKDARVV